jgi:hypothetical protein
MKPFRGDLRRVASPPLPLPVQPLLLLVEEVVILSLGASWIRKHNVARIAAHAHPGGPGDYHAAVKSLVDRGMLAHAGPLRTLNADQSAQIPAREARVASIIRRPATPEGGDAELLVLLAAARALALTRADDHRRAHTRIASIGQRAPVPPAVGALCDELGTATTAELADRLLPPSREDLRGADFAGRSNQSAAVTYGPGLWL